MSDHFATLRYHLEFGVNENEGVSAPYTRYLVDQIRELRNGLNIIADRTSDHDPPFRAMDATMLSRVARDTLAAAAALNRGTI